MNTLNTPGFTADASLYKTSGHYLTGRHSINLAAQMICPARSKLPFVARTCTYKGQLYMAGETVVIDDGFDVRTFRCNGRTGTWEEITYTQAAEMG